MPLTYIGGLSMVNGKARTVTFQEQIFYDNKEVLPAIQMLQWVSKDPNSSVEVFLSVHQIAASASDESIAISDDTNTVLTIFFDTASAGASDLTIKTNSDSDARAVKPLRIMSEPVTALTVSNANSSDAKQLLILRAVVSDTTNTVLKEVEQ